MTDPWVPAVLLFAGVYLLRAMANWVHRRGTARDAGWVLRFLERVRQALADEG